MNLLLLDQDAGTPSLGGDARSHFFSREWVRQGHKVLVLAASFSQQRSVQPAVAVEMIEGVQYRWLATPNHKGSGWARQRSVLAFLSQSFGMAEELARGFMPNVVIAASQEPLNTWAAQRIVSEAHKQGCRTELVHEVREWAAVPSAPSSRSATSWHPFALIGRSAERSAYAASDRVVCSSTQSQAKLLGRGLDAKKCMVVSEGVLPTDTKASAADKRDRAYAVLARKYLIGLKASSA